MCHRAKFVALSEVMLDGSMDRRPRILVEHSPRVRRMPRNHMERGRNHPHLPSPRAKSGLQQAYPMVDLQGVLVMGRKRVSNPRVSFSISVEKLLLDKLNHRLSYNASRSQWIADAIRAKLSDDDLARDLVEKISTEDLLIELNFRTIDLEFSKAQRATIQEMLTIARNLPESGE